MSIPTARRMHNSRRSFVREILKAASRPNVISFAGGLPNNNLVPVADVAAAIADTLAEQGASALQYCAAEGHPALRQWVADQYAAAGLSVSPDQVIITSGSQQGFDLVGKALLDPGDHVIVENPTYVAALQSFGLFEPRLTAIPMDDEGIDVHQLRSTIVDAKLLYCMPNFQNPTGISYSPPRRAEVVAALKNTSTVLIEDDPYNLLGFDGPTPPPMACELPARTILFGSFSKILTPGLRLGWICAPVELIHPLTIAKQAADLCSENLGQWVIHRLITSGNFQRHVDTVRAVYRRHCAAMHNAVQKYLPEVACTTPRGGMFLWLTLPPGVSALRLFDLAIETGVSFVPGEAFFTGGGGANNLRLNFTRCDEDQIDEGIRRLGAAMESLHSVAI